MMTSFNSLTLQTDFPIRKALVFITKTLRRHERLHFVDNL